tara:strand:- start:335 stop:1849 length:1515 start_codon:yes stop_codon:yes gene_type:complete
MVTTAQMNKLLNVQNQLLRVMKDLTPVIEAQANAMDDLGESSKKAEKDIERVESGLGKFINNTIRAQKGFKGGMHRLLYGVDGYFHFKNTMDATLSIVDKFIVRPLSGLKDKDDKQGAIGRMMFGLGGSYRKTQQQAGSFFSNVKEQMGSMSIANLLDPNSPFTKQGYKSPVQRGLGNIKEKFLNSKAIKFYNTQNKMKVFNDFLRSKGKGAIKIATSSLKVLGTMGLMAMKYFIIIGLALTGVFVLVKLLKKAGLDGEKLKEIGIGMWNIIKHFAGKIWENLIKMKDGLYLIFNSIFGDGTFGEMIEGYIMLISGFLGVVWNLFLAIAIPIFWAGVEILKIAITNLKNRLVGWFENHWDAIADFFTAVGAIVAIVGFIALAFVSAPAWITAAISTLLVGFGMFIVGALGKLFNPFAAGGVTKSGMSLVGEKGPELVRLPTGSRVHSNRESRKMLSTGGGNNITVNVQGRIGASDSELRQIAQKVGQMINKEINRTTSSRGLGA